VAGGPAKGGAFTVPVDLVVGERFDVIVKAGRTRPVSYHVRCLPSDFPSWTTQRTGHPQADFYAVAPKPPSPTAKQYMSIVDNHGVPLWWISPKSPTFVAMLLPNGNFAWMNTATSGFEEHTLDGALVRGFDTVGGPADVHELVRLRNGNYIMAANMIRSGVDFSSWGGSTSGDLLDHVIQELTPAGQVVWSWRTSDHIPVSETTPEWRGGMRTPFDAYHINSIEPTRTGFILSFRHLNAIYNIDKASGSIVWKLGGSTRPESLTVLHDPIFDSGGDFSGQHDARLLRDGTVTLQDNGTSPGRAPRAVRYKINTSSHTARLLENVTDSAVSSSGCCGSARKLPAGNWVASWGFAPTFAELTPAGDPVFRVTFTEGTFTHRAQPLFTSDVKASTLRSAMDSRIETRHVPHP
jgi:outer membrane protein assembly factor BamB